MMKETLMSEGPTDLLAEPLSSGSLGPIPESLQHLFNKDPLEFTKQDINDIVKVLRAQRLGFLHEELASKTAGKRPNYKKSNEAVDLNKLNLEF
jgi:hypothetical protein